MPFQRHSETVTLFWSRLSFPVVWEPRPLVIQGQERGDPRWSALVILTEKSVEKIKKIEADLIRKSWPEKTDVSDVTSCLRYGNRDRPDDPNLRGRYYLSANRAVTRKDKSPNSPPGVYKMTGDNVRIQLTAEHHRSEVYSGCEAHVSLGIFTTQMKASEPQVDVGLNMLQLTGRRFRSFDGAVSADQAFDPPPDQIDAPPELAPEDAAGDTPAETPPATSVEAMPWESESGGSDLDDLSAFGL